MMSQNTHMRDEILSAAFCNKKKELYFQYSTDENKFYHYSTIGISDNVFDVGIDANSPDVRIWVELLSGQTIYFEIRNNLLVVNRHECLLQSHMRDIINKIQVAITTKKMSKSHIARKLETSTTQVYRLLNPELLDKNLMQLYKLAELLGLRFELKVQATQN